MGQKGKVIPGDPIGEGLLENQNKKKPYVVPLANHTNQDIIL